MTEGQALARDERRPDWAMLVVAGLLLALAAVIAWDAASIAPGVASYSRIGPKVFPFGIAAGVAIIAAATAISAVTGIRQDREPIAPPPILWIVGGLAAQIALLPLAGFSVATGAVFAATARAFGRKRLWLTYPIGVILSLAVWLGFALALKLVLPSGPVERVASATVTRLIALLVAESTRLMEFIRDAI